MERTLVVYVDLGGDPILVGRLRTRCRGRRESASFAYAREWMNHPSSFALEPALPLGPGAFHSRSPLFGSIDDAGPGRWGRMLLRRAEVQRARREGPAPRTLLESDFLLRVDDEVRIGALRFAEAPGGPFLAQAPAARAGAGRVPPLIELSRLLGAADRVARSEEGDDDLRLLIGPGSSLGGARPEVAIQDWDGRLAIAKFPHRDDDWDVVLWEAVALALASRAGVRVPGARSESVAGRRVLILRRFDRRRRGRIPLLSATTMLGAEDRERRSYLEIADVLRRHGATPRRDMAELWRRVVFNVSIANTGDHLRNHAFLLAAGESGSGKGAGWRLAPAYDLNPMPTDVAPRILSTMIDEHDGEGSVDRALATAEYYGLSLGDARRIVREVRTAVARWRAEAVRLGASARECDRMESAFLRD